MSIKLRDSDFQWIPAGLLENDDKLSIVAHIYTESKASWEEFSPKGVHYDAMPELEELLSVLNQNSN